MTGHDLLILGLKGLALAGGTLVVAFALLSEGLSPKRLTLIEQQEHSVDAREDARGAIAGGFAMAVFAAVAALSFGHIAGALALAIAALAWLVTAGVLYVVFWWR